MHGSLVEYRGGTAPSCVRAVAPAAVLTSEISSEAEAVLAWETREKHPMPDMSGMAKAAPMSLSRKNTFPFIDGFLDECIGLYAAVETPGT